MSKVFQMAFPIADTTVPMEHVELEAAAVLFERLEALGLAATGQILVASTSDELRIQVPTRRLRRASTGVVDRPVWSTCPSCGAQVEVIDPEREL